MRDQVDVVIVGAGFAGMYASWHLDVPSGAAITLLGAAVFAGAYAVAGQRRRALARLEQHPVAGA